MISFNEVFKQGFSLTALFVKAALFLALQKQFITCLPIGLIWATSYLKHLQTLKYHKVSKNLIFDLKTSEKTYLKKLIWKSCFLLPSKKKTHWGWAPPTNCWRLKRPVATKASWLKMTLEKTFYIFSFSWFCTISDDFDDFCYVLQNFRWSLMIFGLPRLLLGIILYFFLGFLSPFKPQSPSAPSETV